MGRLSDKLKRASDAVASVEIATERDIDALVKRTEEIHAKRENVFLKKQMHLDAQMTDLAEFERELDAFDNGAPKDAEPTKLPPNAWKDPYDSTKG